MSDVPLPGYLPADLRVIALMGLILVALLVTGHAIGRFRPTMFTRLLAWGALLISTGGVALLTAAEPAGLRMLALISVALLGMKAVVVMEERARGMPPLTPRAWCSFAALWLGMRPRLFVEPASAPLGGAPALLRRGMINALTGVGLIVLARLLWHSTHSRLLATIALLPGLSLVVHFGLCNVLAGAWRQRGVACEALFRAPLRSRSLGEFWARRWNLAFSEMTTIAAYRPLVQRFGRTSALLAGFALSGLLHEMAISVPVRAGYGLPLAYFLLHGVLVLIERTLERSGRPLTGWPARVWVVFWVLVPLPILFHRAFLVGVVWPLIGIPSAH